MGPGQQQYAAAFDKRSGKQLWRTNRDLGPKDKGPEMSMRSGWATPFIWTNSQRTEMVTVGPGTAVSYDLEGKELWRLSGMAVTPVPSPFSYEGMLYIDGGRGRPLFAIRQGASGDISLAKDETLERICGLDRSPRRNLFADTCRLSRRSLLFD